MKAGPVPLSLAIIGARENLHPWLSCEREWWWLVNLRGRYLWPLGGVVVGSLMGVGVTAHFPAPTLGEEFGRQAEARLGITLDVSSSSFSLTRGILLEGVTARASSRNLVLSADIGSLAATHALSFRRPLRIKKIRLVEPVLTATVGERPARSSGPSNVVPGPPAHERRRPRETRVWADSQGIQFADLVIDLEFAVIEIRAPGADTYPFRASGVDITLRDVALSDEGRSRSAPSLIHALFGTGTLSARELRLGPVLMVDASSELSLGGGHFLISNLTFWCAGRNFFLSEVDIDFTSDPFSFGTRSSILERLQPDPSTPAEWVPIASLTELDGLCDGANGGA